MTQSGQSYTNTQPLIIICRKAKGNRICQQNAIIWSMRRRGSVPRSQMNSKMNIDVFTTIKGTCSPAPAPLPSGQFQPPRKSSDASTEMTTMFVTSAIWNIDQRIPEYSTSGPPTTSDYATGMSKGWRYSSARPATRKMKNASGCHTMKGTLLWPSTKSTRFRLWPNMATANTAITSGIS